VLRGAARSKGSADAQAKPDVSGESTEPAQQDGTPSRAFENIAEEGCFPQAEPPDMGLGLNGFPSNGATPSFDSDLAADDGMFGAQLMGLGMFESVPPFAMIEDLWVIVCVLG